MKRLLTQKLLVVLLPLVLVFGIMQIAPALLTSPRAQASDNLDCNADLSDAGKQIFCNGQDTVANNESALTGVINNIANWLVGIIGSVLAIVILVSAVQIVTAGGSPDGIKAAKSRLTQAAISLGLLISFRAIIALIGL